MNFHTIQTFASRELAEQCARSLKVMKEYVIMRYEGLMGTEYIILFNEFEVLHKDGTVG